MLDRVQAQGWRGNIARWLSDVGSPPVFTGLALGVAAGAGRHGLLITFGWATGLTLLVAGVPLVYVLMLVRQGKVTDVHLPHRRERIGPIAVTLGAVVIAVLVSRVLTAPALLQRVLIAYLAQSLVLALTTLWWKISFHAAAVSFYAGLAVAVWGVQAAPLLLLVPLIGWARLALQRHTLAQVCAGSAVGLLLAGLL